jgi:hypothetical protein
VCHLAKLVCGQHRCTHYEVVQWVTVGDDHRWMRWVARWLVMTWCGRSVVFGDTSGTRHHQFCSEAVPRARLTVVTARV